MKICSETFLLSMKFVKPNWTECYFLIEDIGFFSYWGTIRDKKTGEPRDIHFYTFDEDWEPYFEDDATDFINKIPIVGDSN